jgi:hypothetical protein
MSALEQSISADTTRAADITQQLSAVDVATSTDEKMKKGMSSALKNYDSHSADPSINSLNKEKDEIDKIDSTGSAIDLLDDTVYHSASIGGYLSSSDIQAYFDSQAEELGKGSLQALLDAVNNLIDAVFEMETVYNAEYSASIDTAFYNSIGGLPGGAAADNPILNILTTIGTIIKDTSEIPGKLSGLDIFGAIKKVISVIENMIQLFRDIVALVNSIIQNVVDLFSSTDKLYLSTYNAYNMPCRTDGGAKMTQMTPKLPTQPMYTGLPSLGGFAAFVSTLTSAFRGSGDDLAFSRAELEYAVIGSNYEILNQSFVFAEIYFMRLLLDAIPIAINPEVAEIAGGTGPIAPIIYVVEILAEPLTDTLLLVNGETAPLIKTKINLTPSGIGPFIGKFLNGKLMGTENMKKATDAVSVKVFGFAGKAAKGIDGILQMNYRDHCFLLLLVSVTNDQQKARIANLAQMEGTYHYGRSSGFRLSNAFTNLKITSDVKVKQFMPSILPESLFSGARTQYRGY